MYRIRKRFEISASHKLNLNYESPCTNTHGHNYFVTVYVKCEELDENGMVVDFATVKKLVHDPLDHKHLNDLFQFNPTAENMAKCIAETINTIRPGISCYRVDVEETEHNVATWEED